MKVCFCVVTDVPKRSGQVQTTEPLSAVVEPSTSEPRRHTLSKVSSNSSHSSLRHKVAMNEVRRAFFSSASSASLDDAAKLKASATESRDAVQNSRVQEYADPVSGRSQSMFLLSHLYSHTYAHV